MRWDRTPARGWNLALPGATLPRTNRRIGSRKGSGGMRGLACAAVVGASRAQFVQYATAVVRALPSVGTFIVGNEPNSNYYWLPQFDAGGGDAAAQAYEALLAAAYDAIKAVRPDATVVGGALDPRGN